MMGGMMGGFGSGFGGFGLIGMLLNLVLTIGLIIGVVVLVVWLWRRISPTSHSTQVPLQPATWATQPGKCCKPVMRGVRSTANSTSRCWRI